MQRPQKSLLWLFQLITFFFLSFFFTFPFLGVRCCWTHPQKREWDHQQFEKDFQTFVFEGQQMVNQNALLNEWMMELNIFCSLDLCVVEQHTYWIFTYNSSLFVCENHKEPIGGIFYPFVSQFCYFAHVPPSSSFVSRQSPVWAVRCSLSTCPHPIDWKGSRSLSPLSLFVQFQWIHC